VTGEDPRPEAKLRVPATNPDRRRRVLDAADDLLAREGAVGFTTIRVAQNAGVTVGSVHRHFTDRHAIVEALAVQYWSDFEDLVAAAAESDERDPFTDPGSAVLGTLAAGMRARPGFLALWYGGLGTGSVRAASRPARSAIARSVERILATHWPSATAERRAMVAMMVVVAGDGLLREAFHRDPDGDRTLLEESARMLDAYVSARLGPRER
jgi:AcrR family transcriptional regulator